MNTRYKCHRCGCINTRQNPIYYADFVPEIQDLCKKCYEEGCQLLRDWMVTGKSKSASLWLA